MTCGRFGGGASSSLLSPISMTTAFAGGASKRRRFGARGAGEAGEVHLVDLLIIASTWEEEFVVVVVVVGVEALESVSFLRRSRVGPFFALR